MNRSNRALAVDGLPWAKLLGLLAFMTLAVLPFSTLWGQPPSSGQCSLLLDNDLLKFKDICNSNGCWDTRVWRELLFNKDFPFVDVNLPVHEGARYRVQDVVLEGVKAFDCKQVASILKIKKGDLFIQSTMAADKSNIADLYGYRGYLVVVDAKTSESPTKDPGQVVVTYRVVERGPARVYDIEIDGKSAGRD